jgi:tetratricopeptide (TPR) repeat protein
MWPMKIINNNKKFLLTFLFLLFITNLSATKVVLPPYYTNLDIYKNDPDSEKERKNAIAKYHLKESSQYYQVLADRYKNKKDFTNAIRNYEYSILINNNKGYSFLKLGEIYFTQKLYQEAISYLKVASNKDFSFEFDRIKTEYLLITSYFFVQEDDNALKIINDLIQEYKLSVDENINNLSAVNTDYYSPAYFLKNLITVIINFLIKMIILILYKKV